MGPQDARRRGAQVAAERSQPHPQKGRTEVVAAFLPGDERVRNCPGSGTQGARVGARIRRQERGAEQDRVGRAGTWVEAGEAGEARDGGREAGGSGWPRHPPGCRGARAWGAGAGAWRGGEGSHKGCAGVAWGWGWLRERERVGLGFGEGAGIEEGA